MRQTIIALAGGLLISLAAGNASAQGYLVSSNGQVAIGVTRTGSLDQGGLAGAPSPSNGGGLLGIAYNFGAGIDGRTGWQDALSPGCPCEAWGVGGNGIGAYTGESVGTSGITGTTTFTPTAITTTATGPAGLSITQIVTRSAETATGAIFQAAVTITNTSAATVTDVRYGRAMDWDVPPTEFSERVTHAGVGTTSALFFSSDNGFANANPVSIDTSTQCAVANTNGSQGICDHGSFFVFKFGNLAAGASYTFNIFYGAGRNEADALALLSAVGPELYSLGQNSRASYASDPTYIFAFNGVGGSVVVPPTGVPAPGALGLFGVSLLGLGLITRKRSNFAA